VPTAKQLRDALKQEGLRMTPQRQLILDAVASMRGHISVDQVYRQVANSFPDVNITTVYRTLELLEQQGFVRHTHFHDNRAQYERTDEPPHQHLVCKRCGRDQEMDLSVLEPLAEDLRRRYGFEPELSHTAIVGVCSSCTGLRSAAEADALAAPTVGAQGDPAR
jgi:Fur family transcriptional regulator, ferric uptake regulator